MEVVLLQSSSDQSLSPYKKFRNPKKDNRRPENSAPSNYFHGGVLHAPPTSLSFSFPPPQQQQQPPLLPLPIPNPHNNHRTRGLSCPPINRIINNRSREQKKSKSTVSPKKEDPKRGLIKSQSNLMIQSAKSMGPDPKDLPKDVSRVWSSSSAGNYSDLERFSSAGVFSLAPPPSSLPLPTFSLRPKLSCNAEAAGIDTGATDNLRRILRLP